MNLPLMAGIFVFVVLLFITTGIFSKSTERKKEISSRLIKYTREKKALPILMICTKKKDLRRLLVPLAGFSHPAAGGARPKQAFR